MAWMRIELSEDEQRVVNQDRQSHPEACVRRRLLVIWLLHCGLKREPAAKIGCVALSSVQRIVSLYRWGGLESLQKSGRGYRPTSELAQHEVDIRKSLEEQPVRTIAEACQRIQELTGVERQPTQVRRYLKSLGLKWQSVRALPVPPPKTWPSMPLIRPNFSMKN